MIMKELISALGCCIFILSCNPDPKIDCRRGEDVFVGTWNFVGKYNESGEPDTASIAPCRFGSQVQVLNCYDVIVRISDEYYVGQCDTIESEPGSGFVDVLNENFLLIYWNTMYMNNAFGEDGCCLSSHYAFDNLVNGLIRHRGFGFTDTYEKQ